MEKLGDGDGNRPRDHLPPTEKLTLDQISRGLDNGDFTTVELMQAHLHRIAKFNPVLHAILEVNPDAITIAKALDKELKQSGRRG
jgi:amidase